MDRQRVLYLVRGRSLRFTLVRAALTALACLFVFRFVLVPVRLVGPSMEPTYADGGINLVNLARYRRRDPGRGEVVAVRLDRGGIFLLKRVVGLPGESLAIRHGTVYIDGRALPEPYVSYNSGWDFAEVRLGPGEYFLVGDNRGMPREDHTFGRAGREMIAGGPLW